MSVMSRYGLGRRDVRQTRQTSLARVGELDELHVCVYCEGDIARDKEVGVGGPPLHWRATNLPPGRPTEGEGGLAAEQSGCVEQPSGTLHDASGLGNPKRKDADVRRVVEVVGSSRSELFGDFYRDLMYELGEHAQRGGTAYGAAAVLKRVARAYDLVVAEHTPLVRPTRAEREEMAEAATYGVGQSCAQRVQEDGGTHGRTRREARRPGGSQSLSDECGAGGCSPDGGVGTVVK